MCFTTTRRFEGSEANWDQAKVIGAGRFPVRRLLYRFY